MVSELKTFCENVKSLRISHNLTEKEMAKIAGISVATLMQIENLDMPDTVTVEIIYNLHKHFHIHPKNLFVEGMGEN